MGKTGELQFQAESSQGKIEGDLPIITELNGLTLPAAGTYHWSLLVNGAELQRQPMHVEKVES